MKVKMVFLLALISIVLVSGCLQMPKPDLKKNISNTSSLIDMCSSGGKVTSFTIDPQGDSLSRIDAAKAFEGKCSAFARCELEPSYNLFKLYALSLSSENEKIILDKIDFKAYISIETEADESGNKTLLRIADRVYDVTNITNEGLTINGKWTKKGEEFQLENSTLNYHDNKENPIFLVLLIKGEDVKEVIDDPEHSRVNIDPNGIGSYSILIRFSADVSTRLYEIVKDMPIVIGYTQNGAQAVLNSKIYYYANNDFLASAPLPSLIAKDKIDKIAIVGVGDTPDLASDVYKFISNSLKLYTFQEIKILKREQIDCRDVLDSSG